jgi:hypothetical protein
MIPITWLVTLRGHTAEQRVTLPSVCETLRSTASSWTQGIGGAEMLAEADRRTSGHRRAYSYGYHRTTGRPKIPQRMPLLTAFAVVLLCMGVAAPSLAQAQEHPQETPALLSQATTTLPMAGSWDPCTEEVNVLGVTATLGEFIWTMGREELSNFIDGAKVFACWQYLNSHSPEHPWEQPQQPQPGAPLRLPCVQFDGSQGEIDNVTGQCGPPR